MNFGYISDEYRRGWKTFVETKTEIQNKKGSPYHYQCNLTITVEA